MGTASSLLRSIFPQYLRGTRLRSCRNSLRPFVIGLDEALDDPILAIAVTATVTGTRTSSIMYPRYFAPCPSEPHIVQLGLPSVAKPFKRSERRRPTTDSLCTVLLRW